ASRARICVARIHLFVGISSDAGHAKLLQTESLQLATCHDDRRRNASARRGRRMKPPLKLVASLLALGILAALVGFTKVSAPKARAGASKLLDESYGFFNEIDSSNRVFYLFPLTQAGAKIGSSHEEEWCKQMFQESFNVRDPWDRVALEKNALVALSFVDAAVAMELFWRVEAPTPDARGTYPEDV